MQHDNVTPYKNTDPKKEQVAKMFDTIAKRYDRINTILSFGGHKNWRKKCVNLLKTKQPKIILDVATGTGDFAIACADLKPEKIIGIDISEGMMQLGREKIKGLGLDKLITLEYGNAETLEFADNTFDAIVVGFGVRNFENLEKGLLNLQRILKPGGQIVILETSFPENKFFKGIYNVGFSILTPLIGKMFSQDKKAYEYLTNSVKAFPHNQNFVNILNKLNYKKTFYKGLGIGSAAIYYAEK